LVFLAFTYEHLAMRPPFDVNNCNGKSWSTSFFTSFLLFVLKPEKYNTQELTDLARGAQVLEEDGDLADALFQAQVAGTGCGSV
jgi:hypothetical protein